MSKLRQQMIRELQLQRKSANTIKAYVTAVRQLAEFYHRSPDQISVDEVRQFMHELIVTRKLSSSTCNLRLAGIRFFYQHVLKQPCDLRVKTKRSGRLPQPLSRSEVKQLFRDVTNHKHRTMLMTKYATGLRVSELVQLQTTDIHSDRMLIFVRNGKGDKQRFTLLSPSLLNTLRDYWRVHRPQRWLFPSSYAATPQQRETPLNPATIQRVYQRACRRLGFTHVQGIHSLRHSFATHLLEAGVDLVTIQRLLGHNHLSTTAKYLHVTQVHLKKLTSPLDLLRLPNGKELLDDPLQHRRTRR